MKWEHKKVVAYSQILISIVEPIITHKHPTTTNCDRKHPDYVLKIDRR